ncbi:hypothetical protein HK104_004937, partial [Borealophlyctis nickersoniae]
MKTLSLLALALSAAPLVHAHGKMTEPLGDNVKPTTPLTSQSDVVAGVSNNTPCGRGRPIPSNMTPRATYVSGSTTATLQWFMQNGDGGGPLQVAFSGDKGKTFQSATVTQNAPGKGGVTNQGNKQAQVTFTVPKMACQAGQCLMM